MGSFANLDLSHSLDRVCFRDATCCWCLNHSPPLLMRTIEQKLFNLAMPRLEREIRRMSCKRHGRNYIKKLNAGIDIEKINKSGWRVAQKERD